MQEQAEQIPAASYPLTTTLIAVNAFVYLLQMIAGAHAFDPSPEELLRWGGNLAPFTLTGEAWRLVTSMFLHAGPLHLLMNLIFLFMFGRVTESVYGRVRFIAIYFLSGIFGSLMSAEWQAHQAFSTPAFFLNIPGLTPSIDLVVSVGASGALMGLAGATLAAYLRWNGPSYDNPVPGGEVLRILGINLVIGWMMPGVDQAAHVGGVMAGAVAGLLLSGSLNQSNVYAGKAASAVLLLVGASAAFLIAKASSDEPLIELRNSLVQSQGAAEQEAQTLGMSPAQASEMEGY